MRVVVTKVMNKVKGSSVTKLNKIMDICLKQCETSLSNSDMLNLAMRLSKMKIKQSVGWPFEVTEGYANQQAVVYPDNLLENVKELHEKLFGQKNYEPTSTVKEIAEKLDALMGTGSSSGSSSSVNSNSGNGAGSGGNTGSAGSDGASASNGNRTAAGNTGSNQGSSANSAGSGIGSASASGSGSAQAGTGTGNERSGTSEAGSGAQN